MSNQWFKFYGGEYLSDPKMDAFDGNERSCWVTILSLASQLDDGWIKYSLEEKIIEKSGIKVSERSQYIGVLDKFLKFNMLQYCNGDVTQGFKPKNWDKRQYSEGYSRIKRFRDKFSNGDVTQKITTEENRIEENRIEKKRIQARVRDVTTFKIPSLGEISAYCLERKNGINPQAFLDKNDSIGWKVGKNPMKDWKATIRTWENFRKENQKQSTGPVLKTEHGNALLEKLNARKLN